LDESSFLEPGFLFSEYPKAQEAGFVPSPMNKLKHLKENQDLNV